MTDRPQDEVPTGSQTVQEASMDKLPTELQTVQEAITWWYDKFSDRNVRDPEVSAKYVIAHAIGLKQVTFVITITRVE